MLLYSFRFPRKARRSIGFILALLVVLVAGRMISGDVPTTAKATQELPKTKVKSSADGKAFLEALDWKVSPIEAETMTVTIPKEFDEIYSKYNSIQREQGFNLLKFRGKKAVRYTYLVDNYPGDAKNVRINLLVYKNKVIGGDVCSLGLEGFIHNLYYPANSALTIPPADASPPVSPDTPTVNAAA